MKRLTKSQYEAISWYLLNSQDYAEKLDQMRGGITGQQVYESVVGNLAALFYQADNQFDRERFAKLCGIKD